MKPKRDILAYLQSGGRLTVNKAIRLFHTTELRKIVSRLRREGWVICADKRNDTTEDGRRVTYNEYYLLRQ
jgi:transcription initiation factor IIE alpha subunit